MSNHLSLCCQASSTSPSSTEGLWLMGQFFLVEVVLNEQKALCGVAGHQNLTLVFNKNRLDLVEVTGRFDLSD